MELVNAPVPVPSTVFVFAVVAPGDVFQHTPRAVTVALPSEVTVPPELAVLWPTPETAVVVTVGADKAIVNEISLP